MTLTALLILFCAMPARAQYEPLPYLDESAAIVVVPGDDGSGDGEGWQQTDSGECNSPIVIATGNNSTYEMTSAEDGVLFDIDGDGALDKISWTAPGSDIAFLAIDDGVINNGKELFGNHTRPDANNGFTALIEMATEGGNTTSASLSNNDLLFAKLLLWTDSNHNGVSDFGEIRPASELLSDIGLAAQPLNRVDRHGNKFHYHGWVHVRTAAGRNKAVTKEEGDARRRIIYDVYFVKAQ